MSKQIFTIPLAISKQRINTIEMEIRGRKAITKRMEVHLKNTVKQIENAKKKQLELRPKSNPTTKEKKFLRDYAEIQQLSFRVLKGLKEKKKVVEKEIRDLEKAHALERRRYAESKRENEKFLD